MTQEYEPEQAADEIVVELACRYTTASPEADVNGFIDRLTHAWGETSGRGEHGAMTTEEHQEVRLHTSFAAIEDEHAGVAEALQAFSVMLAELPTTPGVTLRQITVEVVPGEEHDQHLDALAARQ